MSDTDKNWYLGPYGDLRPLICPATDITISEERLGGVHQGLSGARTMDVTGHRATYELGLRYMDPAEWSWVEAMHTRHIPGPLKLINPLKRNMLSHQCTSLRSLNGRSGLQLPIGSVPTYEREWPTEVSTGGRSLRVEIGPDSEIRLDGAKPIPLRNSTDTVTWSVYMKASTPVTVEMRINILDSDSNDTFFFIAGTRSITTEWQRFTQTWTFDDTEYIPASFVPTIRTAVDSNLWIAAPQAEYGLAATGWEIGGGAPEVVIDQVPTVSPRYPLRTATLTLLET